MGKHRIGERTCMGCGRKTKKGDLLRFVMNDEAHFLLDLHQNKPGRGSYLCPRQACFSNAARKRRKAVRSSRRTVRIDAPSLVRQVGDELVREMKRLHRQNGGGEILFDGARHPVTDLPVSHSRVAQHIVESYRAFFSGGSSEWPK